MPNRILKESIWRSPNLSKCERLTCEFFFRLLPAADDYGCFEADPFLLHGKLYPRMYNLITDKDICDHLITLVNNEILSLWVENGSLFGFFKEWKKHQSIRNKHRRHTPPENNKLLNNKDVMKYLQAIDCNCKQLLAIAASNLNPNLNLNLNLKKKKSLSRIPSRVDTEKKKFSDFVFLTQKEYTRLIEKLGEEKTKDYINQLNNHIGSKGTRYKSHYHTILKWVDMHFKNNSNWNKPTVKYSPHKPQGKENDNPEETEQKRRQRAKVNAYIKRMSAEEITATKKQIYQKYVLGIIPDFETAFPEDEKKQKLTSFYDTYFPIVIREKLGISGCETIAGKAMNYD